MAVIWFSDEDRRRMREEERLRRLWAEFEWKWITEHSREANRDPLSPGQLRLMDGGFQLDPRSRLDRRDECDG